MSKLRPECGINTSSRKPQSRNSVLWGILWATDRRRALAYGKLYDDEGRCCAMGAYWERNPTEVVDNSLIDEVAAVNDSVPPEATDFERWRHVRRWLKHQLGIGQ